MHTRQRFDVQDRAHPRDVHGDRFTEFHSNTCSFTVTVLNTEPGALTFSRCPANFTVHTCGPKAVTWAKPIAVDACGTRAIVTNYCAPPSGTIFDMGTTTVECTAQDKSGNIATCSFTVSWSTRPGRRSKVMLKMSAWCRVATDWCPTPCPAPRINAAL